MSAATFEWKVSPDKRWTVANGLLQYMYCWECKKDLTADIAFACVDCEVGDIRFRADYMPELRCLYHHKRHKRKEHKRK